MAFVGSRRSMLFREDMPREALAKILQGGSTAAWYQPGVGVTGTLTASAWANQLGAAGSLVQATGANQPIYLPYSGSKYAYLPAVAANTLTSPNQTVTGDQTITFNVALNDYTPAADVTLFSKTSGNDGFSVLWLTTDKVRLVVGDGVGLTNVDVVAASSFTDGAQHTVTIAWEDGVGATFSYDGVVSGSQVAAVKTLTNAAVALTIGSATSIGKVYRLQVGSLYDMNPALADETTINAVTFTGGVGETWTLNNTGAKLAQIVGSPQLLFDEINNYMVTGAFTYTHPVSIYLVMKQIAWTDNTWPLGGVTSIALGVAKTMASPNVKINTGGTMTPFGGDAWTLNTKAILTLIFNGASSSLTVNSTSYTGDCTGGETVSGGIVLGAFNSAGAAPASIQVSEGIFRTGADSAATRLAIQQRLAQIHGIAL